MRAVTGFIIATLLSLAPCAGQARAQRVVGELLPVLVNGKWGFIDRAGKVVVEPQFDAYSYLEEGLMAVEVRGKWGYANAAGEIVIGPQFADARDFSEGLAAVKVFGKWGFIDKSGRMQIEPRFEDAAWGFAKRGSFSEGLAGVKAVGRWGFVDRTGAFVIRPRFEKVYVFLNGIARVESSWKSEAKPATIAYINRSGDYISQPEDSDAHMAGGPTPGQWSEGLTLVRNNGKWGFADTEGRIVINGFDAAQHFSEGLAAIKVFGKWGFIDKGGQTVIEPRFLEADSFSEGLALVTEPDGHLGYVDKAGKLLVTVGKKKASYATSLREGLAAINSEDVSGYIDRTGQLIIKLKKGDWALPFSGELAQVNSHEGMTFVDRTGKYLFEPRPLKDIGEWSEGLLAARKDSDGLYGYIDRTGAFIIPPQFHEARAFSDGLALVRRGNLHGYIDHSGKLIFPLQFDYADPLRDGIARVGIGEDRYQDSRIVEHRKIGYIDRTGKYVWRPRN